MSVTTTSTASVLQELGAGDHKVCFGATGDDFSSRMVRFDSECILIPDRELRRPKMSKVYSLPLWKRRTGVSPGREVEVVDGGVSPTTEERVLFKVPIPRFISRSPSRGRTPSSSPPMKAPSPILVHRMPSSLPHPTIPRPLRRSSLPVDYSNTNKPNTDEITIPLRECCAACEAVTDECLQEGDHWHEKFTRAARRRRSASLDNPNRPDIDGSSSKYTFAGAISDPVPTNTSRFAAPTFALTVDEVDKRRKSLDAVESELIRHSSSSSNGESGNSPSPSATSSSISIPGEPSSSIQPHRPKASPIEEEDEDQLFPLPSPRRSPASTPSVSPRNSPLPSPSASTSCLSPYRASRESLLRTWTTAEEDIIGHSLSRTPNLSLKIPSSSEKENNKPSGLALSIPKEGSSSSTSSTNSNPPSKSTSPVKPALAPLVISNSASTTTKVAQSIPKAATSPRGPSFELSSSPRTAKSRPVAVPTTPKKIVERETSPDRVATSTSPLSKSPSHRRRGSLSLPGIGGAIKDASLGVLRGVTSFGTGGGTMV